MIKICSKRDDKKSISEQIDITYTLRLENLIIKINKIFPFDLSVTLINSKNEIINVPNAFNDFILDPNNFESYSNFLIFSYKNNVDISKIESQLYEILNEYSSYWYESDCIKLLNNIRNNYKEDKYKLEKDVVNYKLLTEKIKTEYLDELIELNPEDIKLKQFKRLSMSPKGADVIIENIKQEFKEALYKQLEQ